MIYVGIDPGMTGAVAEIHGDCDGKVYLYDTPIFEKMKAGERSTYDIQGMLDLVTVNPECLFIIEQMQPMPKNGGIGNFNSGYGYGLWRMALTTTGRRVVTISPQKWKKALGLTSSKDDSRQKAIELFPQVADQLKLKKHHGRAEALLLAEYGRLYF